MTGPALGADPAAAALEPETVPLLLEQQELLKTIVTDIVRTAGYDWDRLELVFLALGRYGEPRLIASYPDGPVRRFSLPVSAAASLFRLRKVMAAPETGTWFTARVLVDESLAYTSEFEYEQEPEWVDKPGLAEYPREQERFPRTEAHQPDWLKAGLAAVR